MGHSGEAQQGQGTEQVGSSSEAQGEGGCLEGAELERLLGAWGAASTYQALEAGAGKHRDPRRHCVPKSLWTPGEDCPASPGTQDRHPRQAPYMPREPNPRVRDL